LTRTRKWEVTGISSKASFSSTLYAFANIYAQINYVNSELLV